MHIQTLKRVFARGVEKKGPSDHVRKIVILDLLKKHAPQVFKKPSVILEAGCGDTWLIQELSKALPKATFLAVDAEYDEEALLFYREKFRNSSVHVFDTMEAALEWTEQPVDVVLLADVLGYLHDDSGFLKWLLTYEKLVEACWLINTKAFSYLDPDKSCKRYTCRSLENIAGKGGLRTLEKGYFFFSLYLLGIVTKIFSLKKAAEYPVIVFNLLKMTLLVDYTITSAFLWVGLRIPGDNCYLAGKTPVH